MKRAMAVVICLSLALLGGAVGLAAESETSVLIKIPFAFHAGRQQMPAGQYWVEMPNDRGFATGSLVKIVSSDGEQCTALLSTPNGRSRGDSDYHLIFNKYGDDYFLSNVRTGEFGADLPRSALEKRMSAEYAKGTAAAATIEMIVKPAKVK